MIFFANESGKKRQERGYKHAKVPIKSDDDLEEGTRYGLFDVGALQSTVGAKICYRCYCLKIKFNRSKNTIGTPENTLRPVYASSWT